MLFHASISAADPQRAATVIAELWRGEALPFPPVGRESWVAFAGDARNTAIEVYRRGVELFPGDSGAVGVANPHEFRATPTHLAIATDLDPEAVQAIGAREGWLTRQCNRGGAFDVIELWIEDTVLLEVLTPAMQRDYLANVSIEGWKAMLADGPYAIAA